LKPTSNAAYFEVKVLTEGETGSIEIGLMTLDNETNEPKDVEALPLRQFTFYGYSSVGCKVQLSDISETEEYGTIFGVNDIIGCGLTRRRELFFTLNSKHLGTAFQITKKEPQLDLYPAIKLSRIGWKIWANFGKELFLFNLQGLKQKMTWSSIEKSKGVDLSNENLTAKMRAGRFSRQLSSEMVVSGNLEAGLVLATRILKPSFSSPGYFEVKITQESETSLFHIALMSPSTDLVVFKDSVFCDHSYWLASSGEKNANGCKWESYTTRFGLNDIIGCGLTFDRKVFYTLNGDNLGVAFEISETDFEEGLTPAIRLGKGCEIQANFGKEPFVFDINSPLELANRNMDS
jgi:hypothetical protein